MSILADLQIKHISHNWEQFESLVSKKKDRVKTGFPEIDQALISLPGLVTIMGDTGCGKSTFLLNILLYNLQKGYPVLLYENENGLHRTRTRILSHLAGIPKEAFESGKFFEDERSKYDEAVKKLETLPLYFAIDLNEEDFEHDIRALRKHYRTKVFTAVDSLHSFTSGGDQETLELTTWMNFFNTMKNKYEKFLSIFLISEKSKEQYGKGTGKGAKGASAIDFRTELMLNLYPTKDKTGTLVECLKNRDGARGYLCTLNFSSPFCYKFEQNEVLEI